MRRHLKWLCLLSLLVVSIGMGWLVVAILSPQPLAGVPSRLSYRTMAVGDLESSLDSLVTSGDYKLIGVFERRGQDGFWTQHWVQDGPIETRLTPADLRDNRFWERLGWGYPTDPPPEKVVVLGHVDSWEFVYAYIDADQRVIALYVGGT